MFSFRIEALAAVSILGLAGCQAVTTTQYEATVQTTLTWRVNYYQGSKNERLPRTETFASTSLLSRNGAKAEQAVIGPDDQGLWWPVLPPRPAIEQVEQRKRPGEVIDGPELLRTATYSISYVEAGQQITLPTNYQVYRQVARAYEQAPPLKNLKLTLGVNEGSVEKAEPD